MTELWELDATHLRELYATGEVSPVEVVEACADRIQAVDSDVRALTTPLIEPALESARLAQVAWAKGTPAPLEGLPIGFKDLIAVRGVARTAGSPHFADDVSTADAGCVRCVRAAGAIPLATLHTYELGLYGDRIEYGITRNPYEVDRHPGGSSSGPAAALAARELPLALGTDTAGSARLPAAWCNGTALKPTPAAIDRSGVVPLAPPLDSLGLMARSAADVALLFEALIDAGDETDPPVEGLRLGVSPYPAGSWHPGVRNAFHEAVQTLSDLGLNTRGVNLLPPPGLEEAAWDLVLSDAAAIHADPDLLGAVSSGVSSQLARGAALSEESQQHYRNLVASYVSDVRRQLSTVDLVLLPSAPCPAPAFSDDLADLGETRRPWFEVALGPMIFANLARLPALALPSGQLDGLPVGIQLAGAPGDDRLLLAVGKAFQAATGFHTMPCPR